MTYVDPQVQAFLAQMAGGGPPPATLAEQRAGFSALWRQLGPDPVTVHSTERLAVPGPRGTIECLVYRPRASAEPLPVLLFLHGGGCVTLSPEDFASTSTVLAVDADCIVVVPRFRQAPEHPFPAPLEDCDAVLAWLQANAPRLAGDPARIAIAGDSAGGYLAAAACLEARERGRAQPIAQVLVYPMTDMASKSPSRVALDYWVNDERLAGVIALHVGDRVLDPRASPLRAASLAGLAPALVLTTSLDPLRDEGRAYAERLRAAGVPVSYFCYEGMVHGFFSFGRVIEEGNRAVQHVAGHLRHAFRRAAVR